MSCLSNYMLLLNNEHGYKYGYLTVILYKFSTIESNVTNLKYVENIGN